MERKARRKGVTESYRTAGLGRGYAEISLSWQSFIVNGEVEWHTTLALEIVNVRVVMSTISSYSIAKDFPWLLSMCDPYKTAMREMS